MKYKIIFLDIDGTLTDSSKKITDRTCQALLKASEMGLLIAVASGRPEPGVRYVSEKLELAKRGGYILPFNGAIVKDMSSGSIIMQNSLEYASVKAAYELAAECGVNIITYKNGEIITEKIDEYIELEARINNMPIRVTEDFMGEIDFSPVKCLLTGHPDIAAAAEITVKQKLGSRLNVFRSEPFFVEIMPEGIDKAQSIAGLIEKLGISREEIIACGDGFNDVSMIKYAGLGVAMANGCDAAKEAADYIAASNDNDGVAEVIEKFVFGI